MKDAPFIPLIGGGVLVLAVVILFAVQRRAVAADPNVTQISPKDAAALIAKNKGVKSFVILDVRTPGEYAQGYIAGATNIDYYAPDFKERVAALDKKNTYFIYCRSGNRSGKAAALLSASGYTSLYNLSGGMMSWEFEKQPVKH